MLSEFTRTLRDGLALDAGSVVAAAEALLHTGCGDDEKAEFLAALARKGETPGEIAGFVRAFLGHAVRPPLDLDTLDRPAIDVCGTGGDRLGLFNISTSGMFILAAAGTAVVKHGNRGVTSRSGSADVLAALGGRIDLAPDRFAEGVRRTGVAFMLAPAYHPAFKAVVAVRQRLAAEGQRTIFNLVGPLLNPLQPPYQVAGVFDAPLVPTYARIMADLGRRRAWAVFGDSGGGRGMDELSTLGPNLVAEAAGGIVRDLDLGPFPRISRPQSLFQLAGGDPGTNAAILEGLLRGEVRGPKRDIVLLNAAAGLVVAGLAPDIDQGIASAAELVDSGQAFKTLHAWRTFS